MMETSFGTTSPVKTAMSIRPAGILDLSPQRLPEMNIKTSHIRNLFSPEPSAVRSPITNLAFDMNNLAFLGSQFDTPKRKRQLEKVSSFASDVSSDSGLGQDLPSPLDLVEIDTFEKAIQQSSKMLENMPIRRIQSLPLLGFSPTLKGQEPPSNRYGIFGQQPGIITTLSTSPHDNKENILEESFEFKKPTKPVSRSRVRSFNSRQSKEGFARRPSSAPSLLLSSPPPSKQLHFFDTSPVFLRSSSLTSSLDDDDGFLDVLDDNMEDGSGMPTGMASLLTAPLVAKTSTDDSPLNRNLFSSPSMPNPVSRNAKRPDRPIDENTPVRVKRRRSVAGTQVTTLEQNPEMPRRVSCLIQRSNSFSQTDIETLLDSQNGSPTFVLPTVDGKHQDLKYITMETMVKTLSGQYDELVEKFIVIDCRYPYEFEGGHIKGALNLHQEDQVKDFLLQNPSIPSCPEKRIVVIFHCEFSSERGPRLSRFVRQQDRSMNEYPELYYPELYILKGGYKEFYKHFKLHCEPQSYRPMQHKDFKEDLRKFRCKSRSWAGERSKREKYNRLKRL